MKSSVVNIRTVDQLEKLFNRPVPIKDKNLMEKVLAIFPVRLTAHLLSLAKISTAVEQQFLPDIREITDQIGQTHCFVGLLHTGVSGVERMYLDRCIIMPQPACPAHCRFCFRKFYEHRQERAMSFSQLNAALSYVEHEKTIKEVLITGGEPAMDFERLGHLIGGLRCIEHVGPIRVACRSLITAPELIDKKFIQLLKNHQDLRAGRPIEVACHCNHPEEISLQTVEALAQLREAGIHVYNQTVLLKNINTDPLVMLSLTKKLRAHGVETYYIFFGGPVQGTSHLRPNIDQALKIKTKLRQQATGRANPHFILTTKLGKVELGVDGWVTKREPNNQHVWIRTPYTLESLSKIQPGFQLPKDSYVDKENQIVVRYLDGPTY
ncbi:MAG: radical SAM protein [Pseudomonadota bacterium]